MRMWMIPPILLCDQHLIGEHGEIHKHDHCFKKKMNMGGRIHPIVQIEPLNIGKRHDEIAAEMVRRKMNHKSPYTQPDVSYLGEELLSKRIDMRYNIIDLITRCSKCRERYLLYRKDRKNFIKNVALLK